MLHSHYCLYFWDRKLILRTYHLHLKLTQRKLILWSSLKKMELLESVWLQVLLLIFQCVCQTVNDQGTHREVYLCGTEIGDRLMIKDVLMAHFKPECPIDCLRKHKVHALLIPQLLPAEVCRPKARGSTNIFQPYSVWEQDLPLNVEFGQQGILPGLLENAAIQEFSKSWQVLLLP